MYPGGGRGGVPGRTGQSALERRFPGAPLPLRLAGPPGGTADAVRTGLGALADVGGPVLVLYGDTPLAPGGGPWRRCWPRAPRRARAPLALVTTDVPDPTGYGRILRVSGRITGVVEERDCTADQRFIHEVNAGGLRLRRRLPPPGAGRSSRPPMRRAELYLTRSGGDGRARGARWRSVHAAFEDTRGVNDRADLAACARVLRPPRQRRAHGAPASRCSIRRRPSSRPRSPSAPDTVVEPLCLAPRPDPAWGRGRHRGAGRGAQIDSEVGDGTTVLPYSVMNEARVGPRCLIGPFARLRPGSELGEARGAGQLRRDEEGADRQTAPRPTTTATSATAPSGRR